MTAKQVRDEVIENEVSNRRVASSVSRQVEAVIRRLRTELQLLALRSGALESKNPVTRQKRYRKLNSESRKLIREAYSDIASFARGELVRFSLAESEQTEIAVEDNT